MTGRWVHQTAGTPRSRRPLTTARVESASSRHPSSESSGQQPHVAAELLGVRGHGVAAAAGRRRDDEDGGVRRQHGHEALGLLDAVRVEGAFAVEAGEWISRRLPHRPLGGPRVPQDDRRVGVRQGQGDVDELTVVAVGQQLVRGVAAEPAHLVDLGRRVERELLEHGGAPVAHPLGDAGHLVLAAAEGRAEGAADAGLLERLAHGRDVVPFAVVELALGQRPVRAVRAVHDGDLGPVFSVPHQHDAGRLDPVALVLGHAVSPPGTVGGRGGDAGSRPSRRAPRSARRARGRGSRRRTCRR